MFDQAREETLMAIEKETERELLESLATQNRELWSMIPWKINNRKRSYSKKNEVESRTEQTQLFPCKEKEMATIELTDGGRPQVGAQEVRHAQSSMVTRTRDKEKATRDSEHPVRNHNDSLRGIQRSAIAQG